MKKKISFKKMLDIETKKPKKIKRKEVPLMEKVISQNIEIKKNEKSVVMKIPPSRRKIDSGEGYQKIVLFRLSNEFYAIDVSMIDEIIETNVKEKIAGMPDFVTGVISLRGESLPVISLFNRFHLKERPLRESETILITSRNGKLYGILIDELKGVLDIKPSFIFDVPMAFLDDEFSYLKGMFKYDNEIAAIVDIGQILLKYKLG